MRTELHITKGHLSSILRGFQRAPGEEALRQIVTRPLEQMGYRYDDPLLVDIGGLSSAYVRANDTNTPSSGDGVYTDENDSLPSNG